jgi:hypothetical protein
VPGSAYSEISGDDAEKHRYPGEVHWYDLPDDDAELEDEWPEAPPRARGVLWRLPRVLGNLPRTTRG